jgi:hypothetical protein
MVSTIEESMGTATRKIGRTARLMAFMDKGDDMFHARDLAALAAFHHQDSTSTPHIRASSAAATGSLSSPVLREPLRER